MKAPWLTIHELASALKVSVKTIRRAYLSGEIPVERLFRSVRFDVEQLKEAMRRNGQGHVGETATQEGESRATGGDSRWRAVTRPRSVRRGRS
jgi:excisionase family DNA binding protein